jgi:hypothetical protein
MRCETRPSVVIPGRSEAASPESITTIGIRSPGLITSEGCTEMQRYLFSKQLPASEIERLFLSGREPRKAAGRIVAA